MPKTRAEISGYTATSNAQDVRAFLDSLVRLGAPVTVGRIGETAGGHEILAVTAARPRPATGTGAAALRSLRPVIYLQGNIHGGEVEGKETLLMVLRDLSFDPRPNPLDSLVIVAVPLYNVDGNEAIGPQETNRPEQNGPALIGRRPNGAGLDLNRDYIKAMAPETRASLRMFGAWDPDVFVDLHTTDGSFHGYGLTYAPPLTPSAALEAHSREWLSVLRDRMRARHGIETFDYGNFGTDATPWQQRAIHTPEVNAWSTFDHRPRFSTNYYGLRNGIAILSEAYSHDPFERRVTTTYAFVREILSLAAERGAAVRALRDTLARAYGPVATIGTSVAVRSRVAQRPEPTAVLVEEVERTGDSTRHEAGLARGLRRTGRFRSVTMPVFDRFTATHSVVAPVAYLVPDLPRVAALLGAHGLRPAGALRGLEASVVEEFVIDSVVRAAREFEGQRETRVFGRWVASPSPPRWSEVAIYPVVGRQHSLTAYLLDPEADDGIVTWNVVDGLAPGSVYPIRRVRRAGER